MSVTWGAGWWIWHCGPVAPLGSMRVFLTPLQVWHDQRRNHGLGVVPGEGAAHERFNAATLQLQLVPRWGRGGGSQPQHLIRPDQSGHHQMLGDSHPKPCRHHQPHLHREQVGFYTQYYHLKYFQIANVTNICINYFYFSHSYYQLFYSYLYHSLSVLELELWSGSVTRLHTISPVFKLIFVGLVWVQLCAQQCFFSGC